MCIFRYLSGTSINSNKMSIPALEKIQAIQDKANKEIELLKSEAISEIAKKLSEAKSVVADLQRQYEELTGKTVSGDKVLSVRKRLSTSEKTALASKVLEIIKSAKDGIKMGDIVTKAGESTAAVRDAVKLSPEVTTTGNKASTLYFAK